MKKLYTAILLTFVLFVNACTGTSTKQNTRNNADSIETTHKINAPAQAPLQDTLSHKVNKQPSPTKLNNPKPTLIGQVYKNYKELSFLKDYHNAGGTVIDQNNPHKYVLTLYEKQKIYLVNLEEIIEQGPHPTYKILDTLTIRALKPQEEIIYGRCRKDSVINTGVIAIVLPSEADINTRVQRAWEADIASGKIRPIATTGIDCMNEGP